MPCYCIILDCPKKNSDTTTSEGGTQTDLDILCSKCAEPIEHVMEAAGSEMKSGSLRVKNEFKLRIHSNGNEPNEADEYDDGMNDDDIDEDEERYAAIMAAAEDTDEDDEGKTSCLIYLRSQHRDPIILIIPCFLN